LLPVWQAIRSETNVCVRIEEAHDGHGKLSVKQHATPKPPNVGN
jgi:hypothetical protein